MSDTQDWVSIFNTEYKAASTIQNFARRKFSSSDCSDDSAPTPPPRDPIEIVIKRHKEAGYHILEVRTNPFDEPTQYVFSSGLKISFDI